MALRLYHLFLVFDLMQDVRSEVSKSILLDAGQVEKLVAQFTRTWMRPPTQE